LKETSVKLLPKNTILLCCTASVGAYAITEIELTTNQQFNGIVIKKEKENIFLPKFLFYFCYKIEDQLEKMGGTTSFKFIPIGQLKKLKLPFPSFEEQKNIVENIEKEEQAVQQTEKLINIYESKIKSKIGAIWGE
jgi:restriction endonuclease S subunit